MNKLEKSLPFKLSSLPSCGYIDGDGAADFDHVVGMYVGGVCNVCQCHVEYEHVVNGWSTDDAVLENICPRCKHKLQVRVSIQIHIY